MTRQEILTWIQDHRVFFLATADGDQPRVRVFGSLQADGGGIFFVTQRDKDVCRELVANPKVELGFYDSDEGVQIRINGAAALVEDERVRGERFGRLPFIKSLAEKRGMENMALFRVRQAKAAVWTRETRLAPKHYVDL